MFTAGDLVGDFIDPGTIGQTPTNYDVRKAGQPVVTQIPGASTFDPITLTVSYERSNAKTKALADMTNGTALVVGIQINSDRDAGLTATVPTAGSASDEQSLILIAGRLSGKPSIDLTSGSAGAMTLTIAPSEDYITLDQA